eukprot:51199-Prymnesium_polylepis.1
MPVILLVIISWASFFISRYAVPARVTLCLVCYLTLSNTRTSILLLLPRVSYHVRLLALVDRSMYFVFASILEYAYLVTRDSNASHAATDSHRLMSEKRVLRAPPPLASRSAVNWLHRVETRIGLRKKVETQKTSREDIECPIE